jgi:hypothetical protein
MSSAGFTVSSQRVKDATRAARELRALSVACRCGLRGDAYAAHQVETIRALKKLADGADAVALTASTQLAAIVTSRWIEWQLRAWAEGWEALVLLVNDA